MLILFYGVQKNLSPIDDFHFLSRRRNHNPLQLQSKKCIFITLVFNMEIENCLYYLLITLVIWGIGINLHACLVSLAGLWVDHHWFITWSWRVIIATYFGCVTDNTHHTVTCCPSMPYCCTALIMQDVFTFNLSLEDINFLV